MDLLITKMGKYTVTALIDDNRLVELFYDEDSSELKADSIYVGKINNIVKNINAAFVRVTGNELCFLQFKNETDMKSINNEKELLVQITHEKIKTKQAAVTTQIKLMGRYLIRTGKHEISISSKIKNVSRKKELQKLMSDADVNDSGFIIRTNAEKADNELILKEYESLEKQYEEIIRKAAHAKPFTCIYQAPKGYICAIRDGYDKEIDRIITDSREIYDDIEAFAGDIYPDINNKLELYTDTYPLKSLYGLTDKIDRCTKEKIWLNSGAYIVIQITEACTVIDVNTGKSVANKRRKENHFYSINKEAAEEIFLQLRLRNLSGIIIIDFIDMVGDENNDSLFSYLNALAAADPVKTNVIDYTALGLVEVTRKKISAPIDFGKLSASQH